MKEMRIEQLRYILTVYEEKSISRAAKKLFMSQPSLSNAISSLEKELGASLFERGRDGVTATEFGMQIIQNMISPAIDTLKRDVIGKTAAAIPGIGNAINGVTEVALGTAVLVRNGLGVIGIIVILCVGLPPVIRLGMTTLLYKLLAAIVQPISDKRMVGALATIGDGCMLLLKVLLTMELLFLITIAVLTISFIGH